MRNRRNHYRVLQVQPDAPAEIIKASFRTLMRDLRRHPDLGGTSSDAAVLNEAYQTLMDPERRAAYDRQLFGRQTKQSVSGYRPGSASSCPVCRTPLAQKPLAGDLCATCRSPLVSKPPAYVAKSYRRSLDRIERDDRALCYSTWPGIAQEVRMIDFSPKGMRFLCANKPDPGAILKVQSSFFEASASVTNLREQVVQGQRLYSVGVEFLAIRFLEPKGSILSTSI